MMAESEPPPSRPVRFGVDALARDPAIGAPSQPDETGYHDNTDRTSFSR